MEVVWHMVKAWNTGIHLYRYCAILKHGKTFILLLSFCSMLRYKEAEQWCSLAMKFFPHLPPNLSQTYEPQVKQNNRW